MTARPSAGPHFAHFPCPLLAVPAPHDRSQDRLETAQQRSREYTSCYFSLASFLCFTLCSGHAYLIRPSACRFLGKLQRRLRHHLPRARSTFSCRLAHKHFIAADALCVYLSLPTYTHSTPHREFLCTPPLSSYGQRTLVSPSILKMQLICLSL
jgi:hypothetical protein